MLKTFMCKEREENRLEIALIQPYKENKDRLKIRSL